VTIIFITHQLPKGLQVDEAVVLGKTETKQASNVNATEVNKKE
jgi:subfamily B ATP-binding cassette protein HlyB/CyaB